MCMMTWTLLLSILKLSLCHSQGAPNKETLKNLVQQVRHDLSGHFKSFMNLAPRTKFEFNHVSEENTLTFN